MRYPDPLVGQRLANFQVERLLGRGGMASVYLGWDLRLLRPVAIKVIDERYREDPVFKERFLGEARAVAAWRHPNILQIYYAGEQEGLLYFVMEYMRGLDLEKILRKYAEAGELMPQEDVLLVGRAIASALDYAHSQGVVHRDVKPANVILEEDGRVVLADFGLARKLTQETMGQVFGSPHYISPEQARSSAEAGPRSDLYSFGVILFEALTGQVPFDDPSPATLALQHIIQEPPSPLSLNPGLSRETEAVLLKALSKNPEERYATGGELMTALEAALNSRTSPGLSPDEGLQAIPRVSSTSAAEIVAKYLAEDPEANPPTLSFARPPQSMDSHSERAIPRINETEGEGLPAPLSTHSPYDLSGGLDLDATLPPIDLPLEGQNALPTPQAEEESPTPFGSRPWSRYSTNTVIGCGALLLVAVIAGFLGLFLMLNRLGSLASRVEEYPSPISTLEASAPPTTMATSEAGISNDQANPFPKTQEAPQSEESEPDPEGPQPENRLVLFYNDSSLYIQNLSGHDLPITPLAFERLGKDGEVTARLRGQYWAQIYPRFRAGYCIVTEIYGLEGYLRPEECKNRQVIVRTPTEEEDFLFWRSGDDSQEFRVLWEEKEVGRCQIAAGTCEVSF